MKLYATLERVLKSESNYHTNLLDNQGDLMLNKIHDLVDKTDENLIGLFLENQELREKFFFKIKDVYVFKTNDFKFYLDENKIDNSYTQYENRIGLTANGKFLKDNSDVVLDFPYKDCVLEGGQSTVEGTDTYFEYDEKDQHYIEKQAKRKEIFFNQVLAKDEIDRLLEPKAFANIKKYTANGEENLSSFERYENGTIKDNLIIKGNNLLALHSLKKEFVGKIKLIYIDPPYNTGNDSFAYNDSFNHSIWLTFMRNRLITSLELLTEDGIIFVQCDDNEQAYLKILLDEIYKRENFLSCIAYRKTDNQANIGNIARVKEYILLYSKSKTITLNKIPLTDKAIKEYRYSDENGKFRRAILLHKTRGTNNYEIITPSGTKLNGPWMVNEKKFEELRNSNGIYWTSGGDEQPYGKIYLENSKGQIPSDWIDKEYGTNQQAAIALEKLLGYRAFDFSKSVPLLKHLIRIGANKNDIILDFHAGSGSTAHAVLELNEEDGGDRKFIMIEQMDYAQNITSNRILKVIENNVKGSFVYLELAKNNQTAIEHIQGCKSYEELVGYFEEMCDKYFLHYNVKVKEFREVICKEENFKKLSLDKQKEMFIKMLDLNQLYVNVSDMEDSRYALSVADIALTKDFYQI
ncbi:site-specific DNA-methyltransferase [Flavobacterium rhamnosiphilum]|uniref:site-specific DNA-methyltransferase (adenine-specific) n=1 Tax=Flavobacterium rhamnosiphilum TaxID=2541724 RepID=A0A4R5F3B0_9FLAO|nr:site-specific DNA-methyltransferase [Flavobacterium rhamnosiphilum]TDE41987.1 site-specific DNA-methyltransferase [Flavobacterium rhamnosiphilum]